MIGAIWGDSLGLFTAKYGTLRSRILTCGLLLEELSMKICMAQINTVVGDIVSNTDRVLSVSRAQQVEGAQIVVFPELT